MVSTRADLSRVDFYTSHEALLLPYEQALTRRAISREGWYNLGTHYPWIGDRTRDDRRGARRVLSRNQESDRREDRSAAQRPEESNNCCDTLNPDREPGRMTLICRFGAKKSMPVLPPLIDAVNKRAIRSCGRSIRCMETR